MKWVTREKAKVDRIACPWLIRKFVDPQAEFLFVPREKVLDVAKEQDAIPYDTLGAELFHYKEGGDERCSFDSIIKQYKLVDPALLDIDRKSTRLNSSHSQISYAVFCLKKKKKKTHDTRSY